MACPRAVFPHEKHQQLAETRVKKCFTRGGGRGERVVINVTPRNLCDYALRGKKGTVDSTEIIAALLFFVSEITGM